jgi:hypothetical protein
MLGWRAKSTRRDKITEIFLSHKNFRGLVRRLLVKLA